MAVKRTTLRKKILPMVPSALIDIAIKDMRKALAKGWVINMGAWYDPKAKVKCTVDDDVVIEEYTVCSACAAGSVMALSLASTNQQKRRLEPGTFSANEKQLRAIDDLRQGSISLAANELNLIDDPYAEGSTEYQTLRALDVSIPEFNQQKPEVFFKAMKAFSAKLKKAGY